jgi:hypothetical protein
VPFSTVTCRPSIVSVTVSIVRELHIATGPAARPVMAEPSVVPAALPARAVSVPALLLMDGTHVRVGESQEAVAGVLGAAAEVGTPVLDQGALGPRETRFYDHRGTRFVLVFEPFERGGPPRVAAIYLQ